MIKIDKYKLRGYKNIREADLALDNYNVIIGANNSGKSNLIQSFSFLSYLINAPTDDLDKNFKGGFSGTIFGNIVPSNQFFTEDGDSNSKLSFELVFSNTVTNRKFFYNIDIGFKLPSDNRFVTGLWIDSESLYFKEQGRPGAQSRVFNRKGDKVIYGIDFPKVGLTDSIPDYFSMLRILKILPLENEAFIDSIHSLNQLLNTPTFYFSLTELTKNVMSEKQQMFNGRVVAFDLESEIIKIEETDQWDIFASALNNILGIEEVDVFRYSIDSFKKDSKIERKALVFRHAQSYKNLNEFSDGTILLMALITKILTSSHDNFFIEEPENSTHPKALVDLINFMQSFANSKQFIITSHSIVLLNKSKVENIITSCVNSEGFSEIYNVSSKKELKGRLKSGLVNFSDELFFGNDTEEFD